MVTRRFRYIGKGIYSLPAAERLTGVPAARIRRWLEGYRYIDRGSERFSPPTIDSDLDRSAGVLALSFADLLEVRFLNRFRELGVSWSSIRRAAENARDYLSTSHPFSSRRFSTDGKSILLEISSEDSLTDLLNLVSNQWEIGKIVGPMLFEGIEYKGDDPQLWRPMGRSSVVIDPSRSFGAPIIDDVGVPTAVLAAAAEAEGSQRAAAQWHRVPLRAVRHAVEFERRLKQQA